jgi:hypothetical protein
VGSWTTSGNTVDYNGTGAQTIAAFEYNNLTISGSRTSSPAITLQSGTINIAGNGSFTATGVGSWTTTGNTVSYNGTGAQTIAAFEYNNLTIAGSNTKTLDGNTAVNGTLTLNNDLTLSNFNLNLPGSLSATYTDRWIRTNSTGMLQRNIANGSSFTFPVASFSSALNSYVANPVTITNNTGASDLFSVRVFDKVYSNGYSGKTITTLRADVTWDITKSSGNSNAGSGVDLVFRWLEWQGTGYIGDPSLYHHNGTLWEIPTTTGTPSYEWNITDPVFNNENYPEKNRFTFPNYKGTFSPFGIGETQFALPVLLTSISGTCEDRKTTLKWQTASEYNSDYFQVESSINGKDWQVLAVQDAAGNSTSVLDYEYVDTNPSLENNYYVLKQVDFDGNFKQYGPINAYCKAEEEDYFYSYPNPSNTEFQVALGGEDFTGSCVLHVYDVKGTVIYENEVDVVNGANVFTLQRQLDAGIYIINITNGDKSTPHIRHIVK